MPAVDSRQYVVALELRSAEDCPPDFDLPAGLAGFDTGLFLPRDDPDWFGRSSYPPRLLILKDGALHILSHPSTGESRSVYTLRQISSVESGHMLLKGWVRFTGSGFDRAFRYNTRGLGPVFRFMRRLRGQWLCGFRPPASSEIQFGTGLDIKFANALARELDPGETILMRAFQAPEEVKPGRWFFPRRRWIAGDLLALTDIRLLWITDRERGSYAPYGSIASYAPLEAVLGVALIADPGAQILQVRLDGGSAWRIPMASGSQWDCRRLAEDLGAALEIQKQRPAELPAQLP